MSSCRQIADLIVVRDVELTVSSPVEVRILHSITLSIRRGEAVALVGPSGAGKSSLASIVGALQNATSGEYLFDGRDICAMSQNLKADFRRSCIGFVFQNASLLDDRSAWRNVVLGVEDDSIDRDELRHRAQLALEEVGIARIADRRAGLLSGGERQRVAVARALVKRPELIIADEPTGALDQKNGKRVLELLLSLDTTLMLVTHDLEAARQADRTVRIVDGTLA